MGFYSDFSPSKVEKDARHITITPLHDKSKLDMLKTDSNSTERQPVTEEPQLTPVAGGCLLSSSWRDHEEKIKK